MTVAGTPKAFPAEEYSVTASAATYHNRQTLSFTGIACPSTQAFPAGGHTGSTLGLDRSDRWP